MKRRAFLAGLGGAAAWPLAVRAQQAEMPVIGFLNPRSPADMALLLAAFRRGLSETGYVEGKNVRVEYRWARGQYDELPALAADLVRRQVAVIVAVGGEPSVLAAKAATSTIPIVFVNGNDPVQTGLVTSLARPGGNTTGVNLFAVELTGKRLGLLYQLVPKAAITAVLLNSAYPGSEAEWKEVQTTARSIGRQIILFNASSETEIDSAFAGLVRNAANALFVGADPFFNDQREQIVALAARHAIPASYERREFALAGGLMSYGTSLPNAFQQTGIYAGKLLKGEKAGDLPVVQPTKFEFVINLKTAKTLGFAIPPSVLAIADEVIE
jgi:putative tryptophan/tyrosine transport system substrate-binding protein